MLLTSATPSVVLTTLGVFKGPLDFPEAFPLLQTFQPSRFDRETHGLGCKLTVRLTALPLNLTVNQKAFNCQTIPEGMKEYREICAHDSRIQFPEGNGGNVRLSLQPYLGAPAFLSRGNLTVLLCEKGSKRVQQRALI